MVPCHICGHPGIHAVVIGEDGALPPSCGDQCRFCKAAADAARRAEATE